MPTANDPDADDLYLDIDLPADSLFSPTDYLEIYQTAAKQPAFNILCALAEEEKLSTSELADRLNRDANHLHYYLRQLKRHALIQNRRDPTTGTTDTYSYYTLTTVGHTVLTDGLKTGIQTLATEEPPQTTPQDDHPNKRDST